MTVPTVTRTAIGGCTVVQIAGELDFASVGAVTDELERVLADTSEALLVDLSPTTFLDSAGINLLYDVHNAMRTRGHDLRLVVPQENLVRRTLALTGADRSFRIHATLADGTAGLAATADP